MKVTIRECLEMEAFKKCIVLAGENKLDNHVRSVSVMDVRSVQEAVSCNGASDAMVLTAFAGMEDDIEMQRRTVMALAEAGIAALVIFQRNKSQRLVEASVVEAAEAAGLPLLGMADSESMDYSLVITEVMERVLYGNHFRNNLINNTIFHLLNFEKHTSFQQALREAAISNDFQVFLLSEEFNPIFVVETRHKKDADEILKHGRDAALNVGGMYTLLEIDGILTYWGRIKIDEERYYLIIVDNDDNYSAGEITKLAEIIELAMGMWKYTPDRDAKTEFVRALMRGNKSLAYSLREEIGIKQNDIVSVFYARGIENRKSTEIIDRFEEDGCINVLKIAENEESYGVILKGNKLKKDEENLEKSVCIRLFDTLKEEKNVRIFHVTGVDGVEGASEGFRLIGDTWGSVESIFPYKRVFSRYELVLVSNCINIQIAGGQTRKNFMDLLEAFRKEGDNKSKQLLETLETFVLDAGMNSAKTSEFMGIHTNTVQYRLKKINEILGAEISGNRVLPGLTIALALRRIEGTK